MTLFFFHGFAKLISSVFLLLSTSCKRKILLEQHGVALGVAFKDHATYPVIVSIVTSQ